MSFLPKLVLKIEDFDIYIVLYEIHIIRHYLYPLLRKGRFDGLPIMKKGRQGGISTNRRARGLLTSFQRYQDAPIMTVMEWNEKAPSPFCVILPVSTSYITPLI